MVSKDKFGMTDMLQAFLKEFEEKLSNFATSSYILLVSATAQTDSSACS